MVEGVMEATGEAAVVSALRGDGYIPLSVKVAGAEEGGRFSFKLPAIFDTGRIRSADLMLFTRELSTLLRAGLPLDRSLQSLGTLTERERLKIIVADVLGQVQQGKSLSEALGNYPAVFPPLYINMIRAGEAGGVIETVLERLADYLESSEKLRGELRSAMTYPIMLTLVGGLGIVVMLTFVLPQFVTIFEGLGQALPLSTRIVMTMSDIIKNYWWAMALAVVAIWAGFQRYAATDTGRLNIDRLKLAAPLFGRLTEQIQIARFARTMGTMLGCGVPLLQSLDICRSIVANEVISQALVQVYQDVSEGKGLARPMERTGVFPHLALQMVTVGEDTGRLDDMLIRVSDYYDDAVQNTMRRLMSMLGPLILVVMGGATAFVVISIMSAVFGVSQFEF